MTWFVAAALAALVAGSGFLFVELEERSRLVGRAWPAVALAAAVVAALWGDEAPTGLTAWDGVLRALLVGVLALAAGVARPGWVLAAAVIATAGCALASPAPQPASWMVGAAVGLSVTQLMTRPSPWLGSLSGAVLGLGLGSLAWPERTGGPSVVAALAVLVVLVGGRLEVTGRARTMVRVLTWVLPVVGIAVVTAAAISLSGVRDDVEQATSAVRRGLNASDDGQRLEAQAALAEAQVALDATQDTLDAPMVRLMRAVPVVGQNLAAAREVADLGTELAAHAQAALAAADPTVLQGPGGVVRLEAVAAVSAELAATDAAITEARVGLEAAVASPWLVGPLSDRIDELQERLANSQPKLARARDLTGILPGLLGDTGTRRYFLAVMTPSELRGTIGIIGNYAEVVALDGRITMPVRGRDTDLNKGTDWRQRELIAPDDYIARYERLDPRRFWQEIPSSPDFPTVAGVISTMYPQSGGREVDGVIGIDPVALGSLLKLTGPITVEGWPDPLTAANAERVFLFEQYVRFADDNAARTRFLVEATGEIFDRFVAADHEPAELARVLGELVRERHLMFETFDPTEAAVLDELAGSGAFPDPSEGDVLGVVTHNRGGNKIDWFLRRTITSRVTIGDDGALTNSLTVQLANGAPASGLPDYIIGGVVYAPEAYGTNLQFLSIYSPHELVSATVDGQPVQFLPEIELGMNVYTALVSIPPGGTVTVQVELAGRVDGDYRLEMFRQTTVAPDQVRLELVTPEGWTVTSGPHTPSATALEGAVALDEEQRVAWVVHAGPG